MSNRRQTRRGLGQLVGLLLLVPVLLGLSVTAAEAGTGAVSLTAAGPNPSSLTVIKGDVVRFTNADTVSHRVTSTSGNWSFDSGDLAPRATAEFSFHTVGTFTYDDNYTGGLLDLPRTTPGRVIAQEPPPSSPQPTPRSTAHPKPTSTSTPAVPGAASGTSPTPADETAGGGGAVVLPTLTNGDPTPPATVPAGPGPAVATPTPIATGTPPTAGNDVPRYAASSTIAQPSAHRYGLPVALAVVGIAGMVSLLVRFLLAQPSARSGFDART